MKHPVQQFFSKLIPFIMIGMVIVAFAFGLMLLAYLLLFGAIIGFILFLISWIRSTFFSPKHPKPSKPKSGRIIDSNDWKKL